ncbi:MAG: hypothetical protein DHS20C18_22850 [Saprospiraceae bacterium]|nr:MAG: hypothetical protein DHS20C18_22850 [Saprospiraceae bacterium]
MRAFFIVAIFTLALNTGFTQGTYHNQPSGNWFETLTPSQKAIYQSIDGKYQLIKEQLMTNATKVARYTALLANWDRRNLAVYELLSETQYSGFLMEHKQPEFLDLKL